MFGTVTVPPEAETVGSIGPTSHVAATTIVPPGFGSVAGSGKLNGYGRSGSCTSSPGPVASLPVLVVVVAVEPLDGSSSSPPQPINAAAARPAPPSTELRSSVRRSRQ